MYRYYTTKLNQYGIMEYPPLPIPDTVGHYGQNGIAFEGICGHFYGFVEYEKELPASDVANFDLVPGPSPSYYPIDEETARRAHEMMSFRDYQKGSKTWQYRVRVDEASSHTHCLPVTKTTETPLVPLRQTNRNLRVGR